MTLEQVPTPNPFARPKRQNLRLAAACGAALLAVVGGYFVLRTTSHNGHAQNIDRDDEKTPPSPYFRGWTKPDLVIVLSGEMHGYIQPCGCSDPQYGGLVRRYNFLQSLKAKGWPVVAVDLGDIAGEHGPQTTLKYVLSMKALDLMGYGAIGIGRRELLMPLDDALGEYSVNNPSPVPLLTNLEGTEPGKIYHQMNVRQYHVVRGGGFKIGLLGSVSSRIADEVRLQQPRLKFTDNGKAIPKALESLAKEDVDLTVLLCQGQELMPRKEAKNGEKEPTEKERREMSEAFKCAEFLEQARLQNKKQAPVNLLVCLSDDPEPPASLYVDKKFPSTHIATVGHKGKNVGVVGVWKKNGALEFKYDLIPIGPEFAPKAGDNNPVLKLMEDYALDLKAQNILEKFKRSPHPLQVARQQGFYEGSARCGDCHEAAFQVWQKSKHSHAFDTLVKEKNPSLRQFDGECVVCHTVGFKYETGYFDPPKNANAKKAKKHNEKLHHVGCESCHGPGSEHANNWADKTLYPLINPYKDFASNRQKTTALNDFCQKCHDLENDVHWSNVPFAQRWRAIAHPTAKNNGN